MQKRLTATTGSSDALELRERLAEVSRSRGVRTDEADARLRTLFAAATQDSDEAAGVAVVALGGYGRGELSAASDLDVLLLYDDRCADVGAVAERLWYPLWDSRVPLDHSVRTLDETLDAAAADLRSALSLLDARHLAGDATLTIRLRTTLLAAWRRTASRRLPELEETCRERAHRFGELAFLLEPDLKEARGGLRDGVVLRALAATWLVEVPHAALARVRVDLLDVRDVLHQVGGRRPTDRLLAELQDDVAAGCGLADRDALLRHVYQLGRTMSHTADIAWRRAGRALAVRSGRPRATRGRPRPGPVLTPLAPGVAAVDGEVVLATDGARLATDPLLPLRAAYAAADRGLLLAPHTAGRLAGGCTPLPEPWPAGARRLFTALLGTGPDLLPVWEMLDQVGLVEHLVPVWERVRCAPQHSPVHRHTVDRHLLETCVQAATLVRRVLRPDLLLAAALLHDIGKGAPTAAGLPTDVMTNGAVATDVTPNGAEANGAVATDVTPNGAVATDVTPNGAGGHSEAGAALVAGLARRWGFEESDVATLVLLVRHHLLLIETATRRDLDDPATVGRVATLVRDTGTLDLLAALTEADARATGPAAWTPWRAGLLASLVVRVRRHLERAAPIRLSVSTALQPWQRDLARQGRLEVVVRPATSAGEENASGGGEVEGTTQITVVAADRVGLLATVAGVLALARLSVLSASVETWEGAGISIWSVTGDPPEAVVLRERLAAALAGGTDLPGRLARLDEAYRRPAGRRMEPGTAPRPRRTSGTPAPGAPADVTVIPAASQTATVVEVRAHDRPGLFHALCTAVATVGCSVRSAHVTTWASEAVDVFYLTGPDGGPLTGRAVEAVRASFEAVLS
ncbi:MAG TPA: [protein-PII] uridylyltransferase [Actinopolymorphaceae bacterium]|nr:[protein-PII] uridylyltransferase [Actinopolymorphaceae bacterium]